MTSARIVAALLLVALLGGCAQTGGGAVADAGAGPTPAGNPVPVTERPVPPGLATDPPTSSRSARDEVERVGSQVGDAVGSAAGSAAAAQLRQAARRLVARASAVGADFTMPKVTGVDLQAAQNRLQARGSWVLDQQDATGQRRLLLTDSEWRVCRQSPAAGARVPNTRVVVLAAVKLAERCP